MKLAAVPDQIPACPLNPPPWIPPQIALTPPLPVVLGARLVQDWGPLQNPGSFRRFVRSSLYPPWSPAPTAATREEGEPGSSRTADHCAEAVCEKQSHAAAAEMATP